MRYETRDMKYRTKKPPYRAENLLFPKAQKTTSCGVLIPHLIPLHPNSPAPWSKLFLSHFHLIPTIAEGLGVLHLNGR